MNNPEVGIVMGSQSDLKIMTEAASFLDALNIKFEISIMSAHRTPEDALNYAENAKSRGLKVIIAGAGGAAHLPGVLAGLTTLPVIGIPIKSSNSIDGWDSILSILQMPSGVPVATVALNGAKNAGILAAQIIATSNKAIADKLIEFKKEMKEKVQKSNSDLQKMDWKKITQA